MSQLPFFNSAFSEFEQNTRPTVENAICTKEACYFVVVAAVELAACSVFSCGNIFEMASSDWNP